MTQVGFPKIVPLFPNAEESTRTVPLPSFILQSPTGGDAAPAAPASTKASSVPARARVGTTRRIRFIDMPYSLKVRGAGSSAGYRLSRVMLAPRRSRRNVIRPNTPRAG